MLHQLLKRGFSDSAAKTITDQKHIRQLIKSRNVQKFKPMMLVTEYGELLNLKPMTKLQAVSER